MSEECSHDCSNCELNCDKRNDVNSLLEPTNEFSNVRNVIGIVSGKGGVGKSLVTSMLASSMQKKGYKVAVLDADITGPSISKTFGVHGKAYSDENGILPLTTETGIKLMSSNFLLNDESAPVIWRGPLIGGAVKQFWTDVIWEDIDYMFVDMSPGTGDVPLTVFQMIPLNGIVVVTSPQDLVNLIVEKSINMANQMNIPLLGIVENMSYFECPDCRKKYNIFGESNVEKIAEKYGINVVSRIPIDSNIAKMCDNGKVEELDCKCLSEVVNSIDALGDVR